MRRLVIVSAVAVAAITGVGLVGCNSQQQAQVTQGLGTVPGQLFCTIALGSTQIVAPIVQSKTQGAAQAEAVLATNASALVLQDQCQKAAQAVGGKAGAPVSPPANANTLAPVALPPTS